jgi:DNA repair exonuclease SbcCD ATPase subunit
LEQLNNALKDLDVHRAVLVEIRKQCDGIPTADRRPIDEVAKEQEVARQKREVADDAHRQAESDVLAKQRHRIDRTAREADLNETETLRDRYRLLADLLGRDGLQRHLLRTAEARVLEKANDSLGRFSGGSLRLEPGPDDGKRGAGTALDLVCHNAETADEALDLGLLSGSQRFRVCVALALGIGQYLAGDESRIRSVIIDEGFGSLDARGLRDMAEEIKALGDLLDRIIVVSHQESFAEVFPDRYHIKLEAGASQPERLLAGI